VTPEDPVQNLKLKTHQNVDLHMHAQYYLDNRKVLLDVRLGTGAVRYVSCELSRFQLDDLVEWATELKRKVDKAEGF